MFLWPSVIVRRTIGFQHILVSENQDDREPSLAQVLLAYDRLHQNGYQSNTPKQEALQTHVASL